MHNAQSGDVLHFVSFLRRLADSSSIRSHNFGGELTDPKWNNSEVDGAVLSPARYLSYWSIKDRAEFHESRGTTGPRHISPGLQTFALLG
jgi:hypothetical protein